MKYALEIALSGFCNTSDPGSIIAAHHEAGNHSGDMFDSH